MSDRLAFRGLVAVGTLLLFCLGCLLALPFKVMWLTNSLWIICCALLTSQMAMPMPTNSWPVWIAATPAGLLFSLMLGNSLLIAWKL